jgi:transcription antitermination factor NusG
MSDLFYIIHTKENKEFSVKEEIASTLPDVDVFIPIKKSFAFHKDKKYLYYSRIVPDYIMVNFDNTDYFEQISKLDNVLGFLKKRMHNNKLDMSTVSISEFEATTDIEDCKKSFRKEPVIIMNGTYCGFMATINKIKDDYVDLTVLINPKPKVRLPIWFIGQEV